VKEKLHAVVMFAVGKSGDVTRCEKLAEATGYNAIQVVRAVARIICPKHWRKHLSLATRDLRLHLKHQPLDFWYVVWLGYIDKKGEIKCKGCYPERRDGWQSFGLGLIDFEEWRKVAPRRARMRAKATCAQV